MQAIVRFLPGEVAAESSRRFGINFTISEHTKSWQHFGVRPPKDGPRRERTRACRWTFSATHSD